MSYHEDDHERAPPCVLGLEELRVVVPALVSTVNGDSLLEFLPLELDERVVRIATTVEAGQESTGLLVALVSEKPARGLRKEPDATDDDEGRNTLEDERETPGEIRLDLLGAKGDAGSGDRSSEPTIEHKSSRVSGQMTLKLYL